MQSLPVSVMAPEARGRWKKLDKQVSEIIHFQNRIEGDGDIPWLSLPRVVFLGAKVSSSLAGIIKRWTGRDDTR